MSVKNDLDRLMERYVTMDPHGAALSVTHKGETIFEGYYGFSDFARTKPVTPDTLYRLYSMTKPIAALCGMIQFERGVFLMDDPLYEYLPEFRHMYVRVKKEDGTWDVEEAKKPILMKNLFNMAVGFNARDDSPTAVAMKKLREDLGGSKFSGKYDHLTEMRALAKVPMTFEPGEHWQYGYGLDLMTAVVEATSGLTLGQFMQKNIFDPLEMKETAYRFRNGWQERLMECAGKDAEGKMVRREKSIDGSIDTGHMPDQIYEGAATGLLSTLRDYQKFNTMLAMGGTLGDVKIVGRKTIDLMRTNLLTETQMKDFANPNLNGYGYGYGVRTLLDPGAANSNGTVGEFGWAGAAGTWMIADPGEQFSLVFMQQVMPSDERWYQHRLRSVAYGLL